MFSVKNQTCQHKHRYSTCTGSLLENYLEFLEMRLSASYLFGQKKRGFLHKHRYSTCTGSLSGNYLEFLEMRLIYLLCFRSKPNLPAQAQRHLYRQLVRKLFGIFRNETIYSISYVFGQNKICLHKLKGTCTGSVLENYLEF